MTKHFQAIAPDGTIISRSSQTRDYKFAMVFYSTYQKAWGATWSSRRDLAEKEQARYSGYTHITRTTVVPVAVVTSKAARTVKVSKITDADKLAAKVATKLRKAGVGAYKQGKAVRVFAPQVYLSSDHRGWSERWWQDYFSEGSKISRRSRRLSRLIVRRAAERAGYQLDKNCWSVIL